MKKIRIPFNLVEYQKGCYEVETRGSEFSEIRKVRIVCVDRKYENYPILALILYKDVEKPDYYRIDGRPFDLERDYLDLFLVKYEFEDGDIVYSENDSASIISIFKEYRGKGDESFSVYAGLFDESLLVFNSWCYSENLRIATDEEKEKLFHALGNEYKKWVLEKRNIGNSIFELKTIRTEERKKAINAFKNVTAYILEEIKKGNVLTSDDTLLKFKGLLNKE